MSVISELRKAIITVLSADAEVTAVLGDRLYDRAPDAAAFPYVTFGYAQSVLVDYDCFRGYEVTQQIDVWSRKQGASLEAERAAQAIVDVIHAQPLALADPYGLSSLRVATFDVRDDPDGVTVHAILIVDATIEAALAPVTG